MKQLKQGFSFLEIAVVLSIIGLVMAAVMSGSYLLKAAQLNAIVTDAANVKSAIESFQITYVATPGDIPNAERFWADSCNDSGANSCNGDGDRRIEYNSTTLFEDIRAWQHLGLSGYYPNNLSGEVSGTRFTLGVNAPETEKDGIGLWIHRPLGSTAYYGETGNLIMVGAVNSTGGTLNGAALTVQEAHSLDLKLDDGEPDEGDVIVGRGANAGENDCMTGASPLGEITQTSASFQFSDVDESCIMGFWLSQDATD